MNKNLPADILSNTGLYLVVMDHYTAVLVGNWWYWVSMEYWLIYDGTGSVEGGTGWYLVVLGRYGAVMVGTWWY